MQNERYVHLSGEAMVGDQHGEFRLIRVRGAEWDGGESHLAFIRGDISDSSNPVLVAHARTLFAGGRGSVLLDAIAARTLEGSLQAIAEVRPGALIYLHQTSKDFLRRKSGAIRS